MLLLIPILLPVFGGLAVSFLKPLKANKIRDIFSLTVLVLTVLSLLPVLFTDSFTLMLFSLSDNLPIFLRSDTVGKIFATVMAFVWTVAGVYSTGYMAHENHQNRYYSFYLVTLGVLMALCFAGSIVTFYMFYEFMTLLTVPLVMHTMSKEAVAAGIKYLIYSVIGASLVLLGTFILLPYVDSLSFSGGGVLNMEKVSGHETKILITALFMIIGFGTKGGMFPMHGWLPTAHPVAPAPASAVLSGVITKGGVLGMVRLLYCFIGAEILRGSWVQTVFMCFTLFTVFMGSLLAYREDLLKKRLAWSSVSQVSYVLFGISTLHPLGLVGALLHVIAHSFIKNILFMAAGAVIHQTGKTHVKDLDGIGKQMPITMWCFTLAAVGLVGIPPCLGFISKWYLAQGSLNATGVTPLLNVLGPVILLISALLTAAYLFPISIHGFFPGEDESGKPLVFAKCEPVSVMWIPMVVLTVLSVLLGMFPNALISVFNTLASSLL